MIGDLLPGYFAKRPRGDLLSSIRRRRATNAPAAAAGVEEFRHRCLAGIVNNSDGSAYFAALALSLAISRIAERYENPASDGF